MERVGLLVALFVLLVATLLTGCVTTPSLDSKHANHKKTKLPVTDQATVSSSILHAEQPPYPKHIALLLPMHGQLASTGQAIHDGFLAADSQAKQQGNAPLSIRVYDTSGKNIKDVYQQAVSEEADFVVGPLSKQDLAALIHTDVRVPTLALNTLDSDRPTDKKLFQFGLSPKDEIKQIADKAWQEGHRRAIFMTSKDTWGQNIQISFETYWQSLGGTVNAYLMFDRDQKDFFNPIRDLLVDKVLEKAQAQEAAKNKKHNRIPPARQDTDVIFLATLPNQARQIYPAIHFFYAGSLPVYAISSIYSGTPNSQRDQDLNGIHFVDMPWVLNGLQNKFYAFGMDAYHLTRYLLHPENFPSSGIPAATGTLYLKNHQYIYRQLQWATFHNGNV